MGHCGIIEYFLFVQGFTGNNTCNRCSSVCSKQMNDIDPVTLSIYGYFGKPQ